MEAKGPSFFSGLVSNGRFPAVMEIDHSKSLFIIAVNKN
jgi:hypothetical protein